jgi:hypothetical protein
VSFSNKHFSALHCNIRSLAANFDNFHMLHELYFPFSIVGLTEIKIKVDQEFDSNITLPGYVFTSQPSNSNAGGVGFYIRENLKFIIRSNDNVTTNDFEALWVEIDNESQSNIIQYVW